jgi:ketosteroid isomerase-like protein
MRTLFALFTALALSLAAASCKKEEKSKGELEPPATAAQQDLEQPEAKLEAKSEPAQAATAEDKVKAYQGCWAAAAAKDWDRFGKCYGEDAESEFIDAGEPPARGRDEIVTRGPKVLVDALPDITIKPQVIVQSGDKVAAVTFTAGTHTAPLKGEDGELPPTNTSLLGQLGVYPGPHRPASDKPIHPETVVATAKNDEVEKKNLAAFKKAYEAFGKRDFKAMSDFWADDAKTMSAGMPGMQTKKQSQAFLKQMLKGFPDAKGELVDTWAAGNYVVAVSRNTGTNTGPMPAMQIKKPTGKSVEFTEVTVFEMKDGKAVMAMSFFNGMALATQLGLLEPTDDAPPADKPGDGESGDGDQGDQKAGG